MDEKILQLGVQALEWEARYRKYLAETPPKDFFLARQTILDPDFERHLEQLSGKGGSILDVGTGLGDQAIFLDRLGYRVTATDVSATAINFAIALNKIAGAQVHFLVDNILSTALTATFDVVTDRGCFTLIPEIQKKAFLTNIKQLLNPAGYLLLKIDKAKAGSLELVSADADFAEYTLTESGYDTLDGKRIPAMFAIFQKKRVSAGPVADEQAGDKTIQ